MNTAIEIMLGRYRCQTRNDYENALKEILQEIVLLGLWRAKFFEHAAFYGGTSLRILHGFNRFSEDLDFSLLRKNPAFDLADYATPVREELASFGFDVRVDTKTKAIETEIQSAFIKAGTQKSLVEIRVPQALLRTIHPEQMLKVKMDVDIDPPGSFETEARSMLQPIPFHVVAFQLPDLFSGKVHALLNRAWKSRIKGRDWYDLVWYIGRETPIRLKHLRERMIQGQNWPVDQALDREDVIRLLLEKIQATEFEEAKADVLPFVKDPASIALWSKKFFQEIVTSRLKSV